MTAGLPFPLGATLTPRGVNFALFSENAEAVDLCLFDAAGTHEMTRHRLAHKTDGVWHAELPGVAAGVVYGYRVHGPYAPDRGHRFNANKLLLDPYAREIVGRFTSRAENFGYERDHPDEHRSFDRRDNAAYALKARVAAPLPAPHIAPPHTPVADTVLYEVHVKGFTKLHPDIAREQRGTYAGLAHPRAIEHLTRLGITAVSLLPVHFSVPEGRLEGQGLTNYWGYNTIGFFTPDARLSSTPHDPAATRAEFRAMVDALHAAGIEVILDVVYNHSAEGDARGPTISLRGIDNASYYKLAHDDRSRYENFTGCGNTINIGHPRVTQLVLDSLRYWVGDMAVDGFRFDLGPVLGRTNRDFDAHAPFFTALAQDPVLARAKLIAEPWDVGPHGYQLGRFPGRFLEWNDRFRDGARLFWLSRGVTRGEFARRLTASSDRFHHGTRLPTASVNFVAAHDGFTLRDVVSYNHKHNHANGEHNHDGHHANFSHNSGHEGPTPDAAINAHRARLQRALLATALMAQGTPMLLGGDELGRTQRGNNNAYCQDNEVSWFDWAHADRALADFVAHLIRLRRELPALRLVSWLNDHADADGHRDSTWLAADAVASRAMTVDDWHDTQRHCLGLLLTPRDATPALLMANAEPAAVTFALPAGHWVRRLDSSSGDCSALPINTGTIDVPAQAVLLLSGAEPAQNASSP
jgi:glycogen operon protein